MSCPQDNCQLPRDCLKKVANIRLPPAQANESVILTHSGWGDGYYQVKCTYDADGNMLGVHVDLQVVDLGEEDEDDERAHALTETCPSTVWVTGRGAQCLPSSRPD